MILATVTIARELLASFPYRVATRRYRLSQLIMRSSTERSRFTSSSSARYGMNASMCVAPGRLRRHRASSGPGFTRCWTGHTGLHDPEDAVEDAYLDQDRGKLQEDLR